jgi:uncharacterized protein (DUF305 family)
VKDLLSVIIDRPLSIILIFSFLFIQAACSSVEPLTEPSDQTPESEIMTESDSRDMSDLEDLYWSRLENSRMSFVQADVDFMTDMIAHHAQALIMSDLAPKNNASQELQVLAARIINAQKDEIASMQQWLKDRNQPVPEVHIDGLNLMIHGLEDSNMDMSHGGHSGHEMMVGMLTQDQLVQLSETKGKEFDKLFLEFMIEHHNGAVIMAKKLFSTDGAVQDEEAFRLAADIQVDQITEIERMKLMLNNMNTASAQP